MQGPSNAVFRALADPTRREILRLLRGGPRTSGEIASKFDSSWPTISRHLALLREPGLVVTERRGQEIYYELNTSVFQDLVQHLLEWVKPDTAVDPAPARRPAGARVAKLPGGVK
jgi:DNA-binding transcriptional ArsR family regulator